MRQQLKVKDDVTEKDGWVLIGHVGVDSGQLMLTDPCYIDYEWKEEEFKDIRRFKDKSGKVWEWQKDFDNFESILENGKKPNELIHSGEWVDEPVLEKEMVKGNYSYAGCCEITCSKDHAGELTYEKGHNGAGVVFSTGLGDGLYPVFAKFKTDENWGRRIVEVKVKFM